jgi:hypothetical protein
LQNRAAITSKTYETRSCDVLKELQWQPLKERLKHKKLFFMHKIRNNKFPISTTNMFDIKTNLRYNLRSNNQDFSLDNKPNTNFMKKSIKSISYAASSTWNNLPPEAKSLGISSQKFKTILDHYSPQ